MANKKLQQLKLNLYSLGSGLTQLKVKGIQQHRLTFGVETISFGEQGSMAHMLPTRAHSMFSGNNNTSYCLTAYLCKNSTRQGSGGPWCCSLKSTPSDMCQSLFLFFLFLSSFAEMENSIRVYLVCQIVRCLPFMCFVDFFFLRDCGCLCGCVLFPPSTVFSNAKEEGLFM